MTFLMTCPADLLGASCGLSYLLPTLAAPSEFLSKEVLVEAEQDGALKWCGVNDACGKQQIFACVPRFWPATSMMRTELIHRCGRLNVEARNIVMCAGDPAHSGRSTTVGKLGPVGQASCGATIEADMAILDVLNRPQFEAIKRWHPALGPTLLTSFASVMAERRILANRMIAVLRRQAR